MWWFLSYGWSDLVLSNLVGRDSIRTVGYDNERGKGDHKHIGKVETPYKFTTGEQLVADFLADVEGVYHAKSE